MGRLAVSGSIVLDEEELHESFVRASGPGGQNVNKVATAVQLRFDVRQSPSLPEHVRETILNSGDSRLTKDGVMVILADRHRTQDMNRKDARDRLFDVLRKAAYVKKRRIATRPTRASQRRRLDGKAKRGSVKRGRSGRIAID